MYFLSWNSQFKLLKRGVPRCSCSDMSWIVSASAFTSRRKWNVVRASDQADSLEQHPPPTPITPLSLAVLLLSAFDKKKTKCQSANEERARISPVFGDVTWPFKLCGVFLLVKQMSSKKTNRKLSRPVHTLQPGSWPTYSPWHPAAPLTSRVVAIELLGRLSNVSNYHSNVSYWAFISVLKSLLFKPFLTGGFGLIHNKITMTPLYFALLWSKTDVEAKSLHPSLLIKLIKLNYFGLQTCVLFWIEQKAFCTMRFGSFNESAQARFSFMLSQKKSSLLSHCFSLEQWLSWKALSAFKMLFGFLAVGNHPLTETIGDQFLSRRWQWEESSKELMSHVTR